MDLRNCPRCGKLFTYVGHKYCPTCEVELEKIFEQVRAYVKEHPGSTVPEVNWCADRQR